MRGECTPPPPCGHLPQGGRIIKPVPTRSSPPGGGGSRRLTEGARPCHLHPNGFSLIEVMVALAIFGLAAVALIRLQGVSLASATTVSERGLAAIVARNQALEAWASPTPPAPAQGRERAGPRDWAWVRQTSPGPDPGTIRIAVRVEGDSGQTIASDQLLWSPR
ncbi:type II secretion system protein GspI [Sphingomonas sp. IBVSS1]|nr:type II secretion system protein GspI [Sphingomonas sp. IBVSS1]